MFQKVFIYIRWITVSASRSVYLQVDIVVQVLSGINLIAKQIQKLFERKLDGLLC